MVTESVEGRGSEGKLTDESGTGLEENVAAALAYVLGFVTGIVMYVLEPDSPTVRFHAVQSIVVSGGIFVVVLVLNVVTAFVTAGAATGVPGSGIVFGLFGALLGLVTLVVWLAALGLWIYLVVRTYQERNPRIPIAAEIADRYA